MDKRNFLRTGLLVAAASLLKPRNVWADRALAPDFDNNDEEQTGPFALAPLAFANDALEPHFDKMTITTHLEPSEDPVSSKDISIDREN